MRYRKFQLKKIRHDKIRALLETKNIETQEQLAEELIQAHIVVTQATLSRDIREMGIIKVPKGLGKFVYRISGTAFPATEKDLRNKFSNFVRGITHAGNLILLRTPPGEAQGVARVVDISEIKHILGTIAGDDTILVVVDSTINVRKVLHKFQNALAAPKK